MPFASFAGSSSALSPARRTPSSSVLPGLFENLPDHIAPFPEPQRRILLADDDEPIRRLVQFFLVSEGYDVIACADGQEALEVAHSRTDIDLLVTDLQMPRLDGLELARACHIHRPELPIVIMSGALLSEEQCRTVAAHGWTFLAKPVPLPTLLRLAMACFATPAPNARL